MGNEEKNPELHSLTIMKKARDLSAGDYPVEAELNPYCELISRVVIYRKNTVLFYGLFSEPISVPADIDVEILREGVLND